ncbi:lipopolysaccharide transport periplasmic protein LptA [Hydrogenobaculum sp. Y04AAS1]|uniref:lipopolysaccharide transport periplasmic protein LptA n=1 Tax=Hydrogenobaculum sp. (strain Y04AAS1) TaxID=380749 RepID=UPI00015BCBAD|nr:lipopolysaccharide transport periplasmic protein LptA [Hydrogenobaculum sp. Y04AAS1]HCT66515.1 lipopolysaccharide transport periplasmic protein LptA [Hydrogenobaculum sp.]
MKNKVNKKVVFVISSLTLSFLAFSKVEKPTQNTPVKNTSNNNKPIYIEANKMDYNNNVITYTGNVVATRGNGKLTCQELKIFLDKNKKIEKIIATGNPVYTEPNKLIKGDVIEYDALQDEIIVTGNAYLENKGDVVQGDRVIYYKKLDKAIVTGKRVQSIFIPNGKGAKP